MIKQTSILNKKWIKILAILALTFDTMGIFIMAKFASVTANYNIGFIFRVIGTISYPLLIFSFVNEFKETNDKGKYLLKYLLAIFMPIIILQTIIFLLTKTNIVNQYFYLLPNMPGQIFTDIFLILLSLYCLSSDKYYIKLLFVIPVGYVFTCFGFNIAEHSGLTGSVGNFPNYIRPHLDALGLIIGFIFYYSHSLTKIISSKLNMPDAFEDSDERLFKISTTSMFFITIIIYWVIVSFTNAPDIYMVNNSHILTYCLLACFILLLYSSKNVETKKYAYLVEGLYYLMHIIIALIIFTVL